MMQDVHKGHNHIMIWLCPDLKKELDVHFSTDEGFKHCCLTNRTNRASPRSSKYTGGLATFMKTKSRLSKSLDREAILAENLKYTHTLKANKVRFINKKSASYYSYKNHVFGLGSFFARGLHISTLVASSTSASATSPANPKEVIGLREEVEKLTQELHQQAQHSE
ncbi:hypothetical protein Ahy_A01g003085 [Arachis hypogaea]|uniref:Uncharacterized protein n=1 Tax=Arachis hypogaea TaxID=3818 RepID=A0A445ESF6_ARAHY|nr:hypothetical protein Ahy_A01g003085 [Arachis hypogaea]